MSWDEPDQGLLVEELRELAYDQSGELYRDRFHNQMKAAQELIDENARLRSHELALESMLTSLKSDLVFADKKIIELGRDLADAQRIIARYETGQRQSRRQ